MNTIDANFCYLHNQICSVFDVFVFDPREIAKNQ